MFDQKLEDSEVYDYINIVNLCEKFGTLPSVGGLLDQDYLDIARINIIVNLQAERQEQEAERRKKQSK